MIRRSILSAVEVFRTTSFTYPAMHVHLRPLILIAAYVAMTFTAIAQQTTLAGHIIAPTGDSVFVQRQVIVDQRTTMQQLAAARLDPVGRFTLRFDLDSARLLTFSDGNEITQLYLLPGESAALSLHTTYFDESLHYSGDGSGRNNALAALAIASEMEQHMIHAQDRPDTLALDKQIDAFVQRMAKVMDDYAVVYPEMAGLLNDRKAADKKGGEQQKKRVRDGVRFKTLAAEMVGQPMADLIGRTADGKEMRLSQLKGRTTVLDFWATWCGPCKAEMLHWAELEKQYGHRINFVSISVWDDEEKWKAMTGELGHTHSMFIPKEGLEQLQPYMVNSIPRYMVVDKDQRIVTIDAPRPSSGELTKYF